MNLEKIGKFIAKLRKEQNMTQEELAEKIGVNAKTISKWETGLNLPDSILLFNLSKELKVNVQDILSGEKTNNEKINKSFINTSIFKAKKKIIILSTLIVFLLIFIFSTIYTFSNYNKTSIYDINFNNNLYEINGYIIFNPQKVLVIIPDIIYVGEDLGTDNEPLIKSYTISLENSENTIYLMTDNDISDNIRLLSNILNETKINYNNENIPKIFNKEDINDLYLVIEYIDTNDKSFVTKCKLNIYKEFANNKLIY